MTSHNLVNILGIFNPRTRTVSTFNPRVFFLDCDAVYEDMEAVALH